MPDLLLPTLACAVALALVHVVTPRLTFVRAVPRSRWLSFAGGVAVAYVFMHVLPELAEHGRRLGEQQDAEIAIYALSLAGLATFYGLERTVRQARAAGRAPSAGAGRGRTFWLHVGSFTAYNLLIGYLLLHREDPGALSLALYFTAMALHFFTNDFGLRQDYARLYDRRARWLLAAAVLLGWLLGATIEVPEPVLMALFAFLVGGVVLNVLKEELPEERKSRFLPFLVGAAGFGALLAVI